MGVRFNPLPCEMGHMTIGEPFCEAFVGRQDGQGAEVVGGQTWVVRVQEPGIGSSSNHR